MRRALARLAPLLLLLLALLPIAAASGAAAAAAPPPAGAVPLRVLSMNVGNAGTACWESKLCVPSVVAALRSYIAAYAPDIVLLAEVMRAEQALGTADGGPLLPPGYNVSCDASELRDGAAAAWNASGASHEHECVAWRSDRLAAVGAGVALRGRNDTYGAEHCHFDFTAHAVPLEVLATGARLTAVAVHPDSEHAACRVPEIASYWAYLAALPPNATFVIGGDWNAGRRCVGGACEDSAAELQVPAAGVRVAYSLGQYWTLHNDSAADAAPTAVYLDGLVRDWLDHVFVSAGGALLGPCTACGPYYASASLPWGAVVGGYDGMPRADGGSGCDHRQVLLDMWIR